MTGLGSEHLLLHELQQTKFIDTEKTKQYISKMSSVLILSLVEQEEIHSIESL